MTRLAVPGLVPMLRTDRAGRPLAPAGACRDFFLYVEDDRLDEAHALLSRQLEGLRPSLPY